MRPMTVGGLSSHMECFRHLEQHMAFLLERQDALKTETRSSLQELAIEVQRQVRFAYD